MTIAQANPLTFPPGGRRLLVYTVTDVRGAVEDSVLYALDGLRDHFSRVVVVVEKESTSGAREAIGARADEILVVRSIDRGVWAYAGALQRIGEAAAGYDEVVLTGDRWFGPVRPFDDTFAEMDRRKIDIWSVTERRTTTERGDGEVTLPSQWLAVRGRVLSSDAWRRYWRSLPRPAESRERRAAVEKEFSEYFRRNGFRLGAAFAEESYPSDDPGFYNAELLVADGCPLVTRDVFDGYPLVFDQFAVIGRRIAAAMAEAGYPIELLWRNLARTIPPKTLNTNGAMLEILSDDPHVDALPEAKVLVVVHVPRIEGTEDLLRRIRWIPGRLRVVVTVARSEFADRVRDLWGETPGLADVEWEIRQAPGREGPDTAVVFAEVRDLLLSDRHDFIVAMHTGVPDSVGRNTERYFRRQQIESLLNSRGHIAGLFALFDREPGLGIVFPPTPHIGMSTFGAGWGSFKDRAVEVARQLDIRVPFDWASPHAPLGGMWVARPEAVRLLADRDWPADDQELIGTHVRLHAYAAGERGFHTRTVTSARHSELSHGSLEYTLDHLSWTFYGYPANYISLLHRAGPMGSGTGRDYLRMYLRFRWPAVASVSGALARRLRRLRDAAGRLRSGRAEA